jgi:hypothetical protein
MNAFQIGQAIGAFGACGLLTAILYAATLSWPRSTGKIIFIHSICGILAVLLSAIGHAISAESVPDFSATPFYIFAQLVIGIVDFLRMRRARRVISQAETGRIEPHL